MQADSKQVLNRLKTVRGQVEGIIKMVEEDKYCIDISNQILAAEALLRSTNKLILQSHLQHCLKASFSDEKDKQEKIDELQALIAKIMK